MRRETITTERPAQPPAPPIDTVATFRARLGGYLVDMVIFAAIAMLTVVFAGFLLLWQTDWAQEDPSDPQFYFFLALIGLGAPLVWSALNIALVSWRGQTGGQYVAGVRIARENGDMLSTRDIVVWWVSLNPLLFSWPMALVSGMPLAGAAAFLLGPLPLIVFGIVVLLCVSAPIVAFVSGLIDPRNRTLHDRIVGAVVLPAS